MNKIDDDELAKAISDAAYNAAALEANTALFEQKLEEMKKKTAEMLLAKHVEAERLERQGKWQRLVDIIISAGASSQEAGQIIETLVTGGVTPEHAEVILMNGIMQQRRKDEEIERVRKEAEDAIPKPESYGSWA